MIIYIPPSGRSLDNSSYRGGATPQTNLDPRSKLNSTGGIRIGLLIDGKFRKGIQTGLRSSEDFSFQKGFQKVLRRFQEKDSNISGLGSFFFKCAAFKSGGYSTFRVP